MARPQEVVFPRRRERFEDRRKESQQRKLLDEFFDHATLLAVSRLVTRGAFDVIDYPVSTGKEGGVFRAITADGYAAVKVYRIGNASYRRFPAYALEILRREGGVRSISQLIPAWTRREHKILGKLSDAGVRVPRPRAYYRNVLVMDYIGTAEGAAPRLRDAIIADPAALYRDLVQQIARMLSPAGLVHADLSPYNVLFHEELPVLIDVAQSIPADHPQARELLVRDLDNFAIFLTKCGYDVTGSEFLRAVGAEELGKAS